MGTNINKSFSDWTYNPEKSLWRKEGPGHTEAVSTLDSVHDGTESASILLMAAQLGQLRELPLLSILRALRQLQVQETGEHQGCLRWYAEEDHPADTNAAFFIGLNLIVLHKAYSQDLTESELVVLESILRDLALWFQSEVDRDIAYYPNKFLGDLVCYWLLLETLGRDTSPLVGPMTRFGEYYREDHFGWGEHLSDPYTTIMLDELSCLLLLNNSLPAILKDLYTELFQELLRLEDYFEGGPRVPTIRCYAFQAPYHHRRYREVVFNWQEHPDSPLHPQNLVGIYKFNFGHLFQQKGWHSLTADRQCPPRAFTIPCFGGAQASVAFQKEARIGSLSRYPIMPVTDQLKYGLSWQTMPLAFSRGFQDWGFLRWGTLENGHERFHPAKDKYSAYLNNALSEVCLPPLVGETFAYQNGADVLVYRRMPRISQSWDWLSEEFSLYGFQGTVEQNWTSSDEDWSTLLLSWETGLSLKVGFHPLDGHYLPELFQQENTLTWRVHWPVSALKDRHQCGCLWAFFLENPSKPFPQVIKSQEAVRRFPRFPLFGHQTWNISGFPLHSDPPTVLDPLASPPFQPI